MSNLVSPIYIGTLNGRPLRFFKAPLPEPHLVWHAWDDLVACSDLPRDRRRALKNSLQHDHGEKIRTVATLSGIVTIAPHFMAQGFIGSMVENGFMPASADMSYTIQSVDAWNVMMSCVAEPQSRKLFLEAFCNTNQIGSCKAGAP
ncbi:hypothetical protein [Methylobacterium durans]|uniref:hypothetical protein n=1 Tax=Methylobacterium durans TaxID=2202825 RepID=UPI0013A5A36F|nr:hypothetical protein [Methylobacterium durans]